MNNNKKIKTLTISREGLLMPKAGIEGGAHPAYLMALGFYFLGQILALSKTSCGSGLF
jgi:hypothetical protein